MSAGQYLDIPTLAQTVLTGVVAHFDAAGGCLPERRIIAPGDTRAIAWDCEAVLVTCGGILWGAGPGAGSGSGRGTGNPVSVGARYTVLLVQIVRCSPEPDSIEPPEPALVTEAGLLVMMDMGLLSQALVELCGKNGPLQRAGNAIAGGVEPVGPTGGLVASEGNITISATSLVTPTG